MYYIKSEKGYWKSGGMGYTKNKSEAGVFSYSDMERYCFNLDGCTLYSAS